MQRHLLPALMAVVVLAAACGGPSEDGQASAVQMRPFADIQDGELTFEADPLDPARGIFRVTTTEPAICAIVWGETEQLGRFNNSLSMDGTGIVQHDVVLPDIEQGREYAFLVQGTTADGTLYRSELDTFTIPVLAAPGHEARTDLGPNLALEATVAEVSSEFGEAFAAERAIDGDLSTEWSSAGDGDQAVITLDLGATRDIAAVAFLTRSMADGSAITEEYTVAADGGDPAGPFPAGSPADAGVADVALTGRLLTFQVVRSTGGHVGAVEVQAFAPR